MELLGGIIIAVVAGIVIYIIKDLHKKKVDLSDSEEIYEWLKKNTSDERGNRFRSTRAIASSCNCTEERVRHLCSIHKDIRLSTGEKKDMWAIRTRMKEEEPGIT